MLILMCGLPASGKSEFVSALAFHIDSLLLYQPNHSRDSKSSIDHWEECLEAVTATLYRSDDSIPILLDTCGASPNSFKELFTMASIRSHQVIVIWVHSTASECLDRFDGNEEIVVKYIDKIKDAVIEYQSKYKLIAVKNHGALWELRNEAKGVAKKLCQTNGAKK